MGIRVIPRAVSNTAEEIELGKVVYYKPAFADGIAFEVNARGITTLNAITRILNYDLERAKLIADLANEKNQTYSMPDVEERTLIFSPTSKTLNDIHENTAKVMEHADIERLGILNFTNYKIYLLRSLSLTILSSFSFTIAPVITISCSGILSGTSNRISSSNVVRIV